MGVRWYWIAVCSNNHEYSNFSGGADACPECDETPEHVFEGDDAEEQLAEWRKEQALSVEERMFDFL